MAEKIDYPLITPAPALARLSRVAAPTPSAIARRADQEFRIIRTPVDNIYTTPCRFSCYHLSVATHAIFDGAPVNDCALCNNVQSSPAYDLLGGPLAKRSHIIIMHSDDHPYYGPNTILRIKCAKNCIHHSLCACYNPCAAPAPRKLCQLTCCSQYYYTTINDLRDSVGSDNESFGIADCRVMHQLAKYPIYKCIVALEILTGLRWDFPIQCPGGCCVAYNPDVRAIVICSCDDSVIKKQYGQVQTALGSDIRTRVIVIPGATVNEIWSGNGLLPTMPRAQMVKTRTYPNLISLAQYLSDLIQFKGPSRLSNNAFCTALLQNMTNGRILVDERQTNPPTIADLRQQSQICHYLDIKFMRSGISGYAPECEECIPNLRKQKENKEKRYDRMCQIIAAASCK